MQVLANEMQLVCGTLAKRDVLFSSKNGVAGTDFKIDGEMY